MVCKPELAYVLWDDAGRGSDKLFERELEFVIVIKYNTNYYVVVDSHDGTTMKS